MANEKRLIDANGKYTLHASDNTDYSLVFRNGIICVENELGHCVCVFFAEDASTVDAVEVVHGRWDDFARGKMCCCSICKVEFDNTCNDIHGEWHHCPNCGAKMDGDVNDS